MPSRVSGTLTTMCSSIFAMSCPSRIMPAKSVATTSPLTGPLTMSQIFFRFCAEVARLLRQQRRVGRHAVDDAERGERLDVLDVAGVDEELHGALLNFRLQIQIQLRLIVNLHLNLQS